MASLPVEIPARLHQRKNEELTGAGVHHGNRLLSCRQIAAYNCILDQDATSEVQNGNSGWLNVALYGSNQSLIGEIHDTKTSQVWLVVLAGQIVLSTSSNHFLFAKELE